MKKIKCFLLKYKNVVAVLLASLLFWFGIKIILSGIVFFKDYPDLLAGVFILFIGYKFMSFANDVMEDVFFFNNNKESDDSLL